MRTRNKEKKRERETHVTSRHKPESYLQIELCVLLLWMKLLLRRATEFDKFIASLMLWLINPLLSDDFPFQPV